MQITCKNGKHEITLIGSQTQITKELDKWKAEREEESKLYLIMEFIREKGKEHNIPDNSNLSILSILKQLLGEKK